MKEVGGVESRHAATQRTLGMTDAARLMPSAMRLRLNADGDVQLASWGNDQLNFSHEGCE